MAGYWAANGRFREKKLNMQSEQFDKRPLARSMMRGFACKCPSCGEASVFSGTLTIKTICEVCKVDLSHHQADDLPAYLNILIVGHVVIGFMLFMTRYNLMGMWATTFTTAGLCIFVSVLLMRPLKGMILGSQWALRMHGFDEEENQIA